MGGESLDFAGFPLENCGNDVEGFLLRIWSGILFLYPT